MPYCLKHNRFHLKSGPKASQSDQELLRHTGSEKDYPYFLLKTPMVQGGQAKMVVLDGLVKVNGEICLSRGKKLREGDFFEFEKVIYDIVKN